MKDGKYEEKDLSPRTIEGIEREVRCVSPTTIKSDGAIRAELVQDALNRLNKFKS